MAEYVRFEGGLGLERALLELSTKSAQRVGRYALRRAAAAVLKQAKANVRKREPRLVKALKVRVDRMKTEKAVLSALVYVSAKAFDYRPRTTQRRSRIRGRLQARRYDYQIGSRPDVYAAFLEFGRIHQGVRAYPFMRAAWAQEGGANALQRLKDDLGQGLVREATRLARGR